MEDIYEYFIPAHTSAKVMASDVYNGHSHPVWVTVRKASDDMSKNPENLYTSEAMSKECWRLLDENDSIQDGDEFYDCDKWRRVTMSIGRAFNGMHPFRRRITLPAPLTPRDIHLDPPQDGQPILFYNEARQEWRYSTYVECPKKTLTGYWLPQDALPVPVQEKSLADHLEFMSNKGHLSMNEKVLIERAVKELRK
jgi:hypothetical protein